MPRTPLASVYLNDQRVGLLGDPRPRVSKVLEAGGLRGHHDVVRSRSPGSIEGEPLAPDEVIDRTERPEDPVYLVAAAIPEEPTDRPRPRRRNVAFPNPGSPLPRLRGIAAREPSDDATPYRSRSVRPADRTRLRRL